MEDLEEDLVPELEQELEALESKALTLSEVALQPLCPVVMKDLKDRGHQGLAAEPEELRSDASVDPLDLAVGYVVLAFGLVEEEVEVPEGPLGLVRQLRRKQVLTVQLRSVLCPCREC